MWKITQLLVAAHNAISAKPATWHFSIYNNLDFVWIFVSEIGKMQVLLTLPSQRLTFTASRDHLPTHISNSTGDNGVTSHSPHRSFPVQTTDASSRVLSFTRRARDVMTLTTQQPQTGFRARSVLRHAGWYASWNLPSGPRANSESNGLICRSILLEDIGCAHCIFPPFTQRAQRKSERKTDASFEVQVPQRQHLSRVLGVKKWLCTIVTTAFVSFQAFSK